MGRQLTNTEITALTMRGCVAESWSDVVVAEDFDANRLGNVRFYGRVEIGSMKGTVSVKDGFERECSITNATLRNVTIGDGCLIENVHGHIANYVIGSGCYISDVGVLTTLGRTTFGNGTVVSVLNEGGDGNVVLYDKLTAQLAWLMMHYPVVRTMVQEEIAGRSAEQGVIGDGCRIVGAKKIVDAWIGDYAEIDGASRIENVTVCSSKNASTQIGPDVLIDNSIVAQGAKVLDGAKVDNSFVGEAVHIGKGFSSEASLFFANAYMDNGEACAAVCGPFACSHHKSTLLIGGEFSFYNAGSGTNQSNHAYKMGPIHWGTLERGAKTASGSHILWPAHIGCFSMVMGKLTVHPRIENLPFSYVLATGEKTYIVPGINIRTVGTWRDVNKWPKRDARSKECRNDFVNFAFPNPYIIQYVIAGRKLLSEMLETQGSDNAEYYYEGCYIKHKAVVDGLRYYDLILRLYNGELPEEEWLDLCGMILPKSTVDELILHIKNGKIASSDDVIAALRKQFEHYGDRWGIGGSDESDKAVEEWLDMVRQDAKHEFELGDVDKDMLEEFLSKV